MQRFRALRSSGGLKHQKVCLNLQQLLVHLLSSSSCLQVLYNAAAVYCQMGQWDRASQVLVSEDRAGGRVPALDLALENILVGLTAVTWEQLSSAPSAETDQKLSLTEAGGRLSSPGPGSGDFPSPQTGRGAAEEERLPGQSQGRAPPGGLGQNNRHLPHPGF